MCKFNLECQDIEGKCTCSANPPCKSNNISSGIVCPQPMRVPKPSLPSNYVMQILQQQSAIIRMLTEQNDLTNKKLGCLLKKLERVGQSETNLTVVDLPDESTSSKTLLSTLCGNAVDFHYVIKMTSEIPSPVFKERAFGLEAQIVDMKGNSVTLAKSVHFKILLFTSENPPKLLSINTSGDKIMRGSVETDTKSKLSYNKIVIKEVTSHFRNGCFFLVVSPLDTPEIKPLIIDNLVVKARKVNPDGNPRKKLKSEPESNTSLVSDIN